MGEAWWSQRFIHALEAFTDPERLARGRAYARSGQVLELELSAGEVRALVQGARPDPYRVRIQVTPLGAADWRRAEHALAARAAYLASLLGGEMPADIEDVFLGCKLSLFPASAADVRTECSCPDSANPCKHIAAVYYILAERFDEDPFLIFAWRGRSRAELMRRLRTARERHAGGADKGRSGAPTPARVGSSAPSMVKESGYPVSDDIAVPVFPDGPAADTEPVDAGAEASFWTLDLEGLPTGGEPNVPHVPSAVLRQLGPGPIVLRGRDLGEWLAPVYDILAGEAARLLDRRRG